MDIESYYEERALEIEEELRKEGYLSDEIVKISYVLFKMNFPMEKTIPDASRTNKLVEEVEKMLKDLEN